MMLSGNARLAGVMGWPVSHSRSPRLHGYWLREHAIDGAYVPLGVAPENLPAALAALPVLGFRGVNLTVPHKEAAVSLCDAVDDHARRVGAVNTIVVDPNGRLQGSNTDGYGFLENLRQESSWTADDGPAVVLGAGGAARAIAVALLDVGVPALRIANRTAARAEALACALEGPVETLLWEARGEALSGAALLVNATTLGMAGAPPLEIDLAALPPRAVVNDVVYAPLETPLLAAARARGNPAVDGLGMLLHQARPGFEQWFGAKPRVDAALRAFVLSDAS